MYIMNIIYFLCILYIHLFYKHYIHLWMHVNSMNNSDRPLCCSVCVFVRWLPAWQTQALWASEKQLTAWWDHLSASLVQRMVFLNACPCVIWLQGFSCTWRFWRACRTICRHPSNLVALGLLRCVSRDLEKKHQWGGADDFASWSRRVWSGGTWQNLGAFPCCNCWKPQWQHVFFWTSSRKVYLKSP